MSDLLQKDLDAGVIDAATIGFLVQQHHARHRQGSRLATRCRSRDGHDLVIHTRSDGDVEVLLGIEVDQLGKVVGRS